MEDLCFNSSLWLPAWGRTFRWGFLVSAPIPKAGPHLLCILGPYLGLRSGGPLQGRLCSLRAVGREEVSEAAWRGIPDREGSWLWPPEDLGSKGLEGSSSICVGKQGILRRGGNETSVSFTTESKVAGSWLLGDGDSACGGGRQ